MMKKIRVLEVKSPSTFDVGGEYEILRDDPQGLLLKVGVHGIFIDKNDSCLVSKWEYVIDGGADVYKATDAAKWRKLEDLIEHGQGDDCPTKLSFLVLDTLERTLELVTGDYSELTQAILDKKQLTHGRRKLSQISLYEAPRGYEIIEPECPQQKAIREAREEVERATAKLKALKENYIDESYNA